jgi:hypothetical protein
MALSVIGSGFGRTGTASLKAALEQLGFGPCHHMEEVLRNPENVRCWQALSRGEAVDWNEVFAGYSAQVDWPGCHFWRELVVAFPDAKVLHSVRSEESWWRSYSQTIGMVINNYPQMPMPPHVRDMMDASLELFIKPTFGSANVDRETALRAYNLRTEQVLSAVPPDRLLVFDVAEGWAPLCAFLSVPLPEVPFPHLNSTSDFLAAVGGELHQA